MLAGEVALESRDTQLCRTEPGKKKRAGAADEAADRERQMMLASSRNPGLEQVLPEWSCPAGSTASHIAKGTFHEHKCPFLSEALQQRENR